MATNKSDDHEERRVKIKNGHVKNNFIKKSDKMIIHVRSQYTKG